MKIGAKTYAEIKVENVADAIIVPISTDKPEVPEKIQAKWQRSTDLMARIMNVPSGQITKFTEENLVIFAAYAGAQNPFKNGDTAPLGTGMFCETVVGRNTPMLVNDIQPVPFWKNNPLVGTGMLSYIGVPIKWEDGEVFGTFCFLDNKANNYSTLFLELMVEFKNVIEADLQSILLQQDLRNRLSAQEMVLREAHHRINNHFTLLINYIQLRALQRKDNRDMHNMLIDIQNRLRSISLIHEELCRSARKKLPPLNEYVAKLCDQIIYDVTKNKIARNYTIEPLDLPVELTASIGLIISELLTNSIKHAFEGVTSPAIDIRIERRNNKRISLRYRDNGKGLPAGFDIKSSRGLGMNLIGVQVEQLCGEIEIGSSKGAEFRITING